MVCAVGADGEVRIAGGDTSKMQVYPMFNVRFQQIFILINAFSVLTSKFWWYSVVLHMFNYRTVLFSFSFEVWRGESCI